MDTSLIQTPQQFEDFGLGRLHLEDVHDLDYLMTQRLEPEQVLKPYRYYATGGILDQGSTPQCTAYSGNAWLRSYPIRNEMFEPQHLYCEAQKRDPWDGDCSDQLYDGSSVRAIFKYFQEQQRVSNYLWAFNADDVRRWILSDKGPVVVGTRWYRSMFYANRQTGIVPVDFDGAVDGGHAYLINGANDRKKLFRVTNSWGERWGQRGRGWISYDDLDTLIRLQGEACTALELRA